MKLRDVSPQKDGDTHTEEGVTKKRSDIQREYTHSFCMWVKHEINIPLQKLDWWQKKKNVKKKSYNLLHQQRCRGCRIIYRSQEAEEGELSNSLKILNKMHSIEERILADSVYAIITYQSMLKECVIKIVDTNEDENCSQDNLCLERTRSNTSKCFGTTKNSDILRNSWEAEIKIADADKSPNSIRESQLAERRNYKEEKYMQKTHTRTTIWVRKPRRKFMKQAIESCIRQNSSNSLQMPTWDSKEYNGEVYTLMEYDVVVYKRSSLQVGNYYFTMNRNSDSKLHTKATTIVRKRVCVGKQRSIHSYIWRLVEKQTSGPRPSERDQKNRKEVWRYSLKDGNGVMSFFLFFLTVGVAPTGVRTHVVATTVCATGCVHTLTCCTHILLVHIWSARTFAHSSCVWHTCTTSSVHKMLFACACRHLSLTHLLPSHVSPVLAPAVPWQPTSIPLLTLTSTTSCRTFQSWKRRSSALRTRTSCLATWPSSFLPQDQTDLYWMVPDHWEVTMFLEIQYTAGAQVNGVHQLQGHWRWMQQSEVFTWSTSDQVDRKNKFVCWEENARNDDETWCRGSGLEENTRTTTKTTISDWKRPDNRETEHTTSPKEP